MQCAEPDGVDEVSRMGFAKSIDNAGIINAKLVEAMGFAI
jgi:hypothetical protein